VSKIPLTHDFKETIRARVERDPDFRRALLVEAVDSILQGELAVALLILRDYVNATVGFRGLGESTRLPVKRLMSMLGPKGNPSAANLASILAALQKAEEIQFDLTCRKAVCD
jgi:hypothetical protein